MPYLCSSTVMAADEPTGVDDAPILQAAIDEATRLGVGRVQLQAGAEYVLAPPSRNSQALIEVMGQVRIDMCGATIRLAAHHWPGARMIGVSAGARLHITGGTIRGDRTGHDYTTITSTHEFGYGLYADGGSLHVEDMDIYDHTGDAICVIGDQTCELVATRTRLHHNRRQGVSVLAYGRVLLDDCHIHDIGASDGIPGTAPMGGVDLEPASRSQRIERAVIRNTRIDCPVKAIVTSHTVDRLVVDGCVLRGQVLHTAAGRAAFRDCTVSWGYLAQHAVPTFGAALADHCSITASRWRWDGVVRDCVLTPAADGVTPMLWIGAAAVLDNVEHGTSYVVADERT